MTYNENKKVFETTWRTDTEHLEGVLTSFSGNEVLLEEATISKYTPTIEKIHSEARLIEI